MYDNDENGNFWIDYDVAFQKSISEAWIIKLKRGERNKILVQIITVFVSNSAIKNYYLISS